MNNMQDQESEQDSEPKGPKKGSLMVVGSGIKCTGQITAEAHGWIAQADHVLYLVADPATEIWIKQINPSNTNLSEWYLHGKPRQDIYQQITKVIVDQIGDRNVCAVFYGHPGVLVSVAHLAIRIARKLGYRAAMLPAISAFDCLIADLVTTAAEWEDPKLANLIPYDLVADGCQTFTASTFLLRPNERLQQNTDCHLVLWQLADLNEPKHFNSRPDGHALYLLREKLTAIYDEDHDVMVYQAAKYPTCKPLMLWTKVSLLDPAMVTTTSTLYVPPTSDQQVSDLDMRERLNKETRQEPRKVPYPASRGASALADSLAKLSWDPSRLAELERTLNVLDGLKDNPRLIAELDPNILQEYRRLLTPQEFTALVSPTDRALNLRLAMLEPQQAAKEAGAPDGAPTPGQVNWAGTSRKSQYSNKTTSALQDAIPQDAICSPRSVKQAEQATAQQAADLVKQAAELVKQADDGSIINWVHRPWKSGGADGSASPDAPAVPG